MSMTKRRGVANRFDDITLGLLDGGASHSDNMHEVRRHSSLYCQVIALVIFCIPFPLWPFLLLQTLRHTGSERSCPQ